jgi:hypothetical protein
MVDDLSIMSQISFSIWKNILRTLYIISYGRLCIYHHAIENQDIWCGVYYHLAIVMLLMLQASCYL